MSINISLAHTMSRIAFSAGAALLSANAFAFDYPAPAAADPLQLRACPVQFFGSISHNCELMGLVGAVSRVSYSFSDGTKEPDLIFQFDTNGRVTEVQQKIRDVIGGWARHKYAYGTDGALNAVTFNDGPPLGEFRYEDGKLVTGYGCKYTYSGTDKVSVDADCKDRYRAYQYHGEMDGRGRLFRIDKIGAQQLNTRGPLECTWTTKGKQSSSQCSDGYYLHQVDYNERMRPVSYSRKGQSGKESLVLAFSYEDDKVGNWTTQTIHYLEMSAASQLPADNVRSRTIEYFK